MSIVIEKSPFEFPYCNLYEVRIVDRFPGNCPFKAERPLEAIFAQRQQAFADQSVDGHRIVDTCNECVGRLLNHPRVKELREHGR